MPPSPSTSHTHEQHAHTHPHAARETLNRQVVNTWLARDGSSQDFIEADNDNDYNPCLKTIHAQLMFVNPTFDPSVSVTCHEREVGGTASALWWPELPVLWQITHLSALSCKVCLHLCGLRPQSYLQIFAIHWWVDSNNSPRNSFIIHMSMCVCVQSMRNNIARDTMTWFLLISSFKIYKKFWHQNSS